ncbi:hypothetical protein KA001_00650 [Patescibacteria group bacterium]|nr:hypothetical protein [Patescibacteria group bacterium]
MDTQSILLLVLLLLSVNLILVGVYIILVLKDVRKLIKNAAEFVETTKHTITNVTTLSAALPILIKTSLKVYKNLQNGKK